MSYNNTKLQEKARYNAIKEVKSGRKIAQVARRYGCFRSTIYRWLKKYQTMLDNHEIGLRTQHLPTISSRPKTSPRSLDNGLIEQIIAIRIETKRCAEVVWMEAKNRGLDISLSSVRRIIKRTHLERAKSKWYRYRKFTKRPHAGYPGALVEVDTVHFYHPITKERKYATSVVDVYSRMAFVYFHDNMQQYHSVKAVLLARKKFGFHFDTVQTDNGSEFGKKFQDEIIRRGMKWRHTRVRRPNDNAHVERFNRTLREKCLGNYIPTRETLKQTQQRTEQYLDFYNNKRLHLGIQFMTPLQKCSQGLELN